MLAATRLKSLVSKLVREPVAVLQRHPRALAVRPVRDDVDALDPLQSESSAVVVAVAAAAVAVGVLLSLAAAATPLVDEGVEARQLTLHLRLVPVTLHRLACVTT